MRAEIYGKQESIKKEKPFTFSYLLRKRYTLIMNMYIMITMIAIFVVIVPQLYAETFKSDPFVQSLSH